MRKESRDLVPVHGGLDEPVDRVVPLKERKRFLAETEGLPSVRVTRADLSTVHRLADGALSPLEGPMGAEVWHRVLDERRIYADGRPYAWTIPLSLPITDAEAAAITPGDSVALREESGRVVVESDPRQKLLGGRIRALPQVHHEEYGEYMFSPRMTRALIRERKWERALAFQTRNPLHRAHEYALVAGAERLTREGNFTGVVLNPLVGELKGDDVPAVTRMRCYKVLHDRCLLGEGDKDEALWESVGYDINDVFELIGLDIKMFYGGPSEAVMHSIYRQNYGFSDLVIGRKHADAPFEDGKPIWGDFDAQEIFEELQGELHLRPCKIGFAAFYESLGRVDLTDDHPDEKPYAISGTRVREQLRGGERPDPRIMRPETADILIEAYRQRG
jgi:sulfate adenylyltransferase